jgi:exopolysaccharide biosynthesis polyprenyl glycosylphosphotransferase
MLKKIVLLVSDVVILYGSLALTVFIRYGDRFDKQLDLHLIPFTLIFALWLVVFYISNFYEIQNLKNGAQFFSAFINSSLVALLLSIAFFYILPLYGITPKTNLLLFALIFSLLGFMNRFLFNKLFERVFIKPLVIVGLNNQSLELARFIKSNPQLGYQLTHVVDLNPLTEMIEMEFSEFRIIKGLDGLKEIVEEESINSIVLSPEVYKIPQIINFFYHSLSHRITFYDLSIFYERTTGMIPLGAINQVWFLENLSEGGKRGYEISKRFIDITLSLIIGIVSLIFYPVIMMSILLSSKGPIFYTQNRVGRHDKNFRIIKFRTMIVDAEKNGAVWAKENDMRVTRLGNFMRKTRIDELPQVWNILKGEMSFVGPRAERPEFHSQLQESVPFFQERYLIKPGLTGWAQINYRYGGSVDDTAVKLKYDLYYIKNRSLILDLGIILKTIRIALQQAGR